MKSLAGATCLLLSMGFIHAAESPSSATGTISVVVQGAVRKPQKLTLPKGSTVSQALGLCAGLTDTAKGRDISITSVSAGGAPSKPVKFDAAAVMRKSAPDVPLKDGDVVKVPDSAPAPPPAPAAPSPKK